MDEARRAFLAGERPDDIALYLARSVVDDERLADRGTPVEDGVVIVIDGTRGRNAFAAATGTDAMTFAGSAMKREGTVSRDLTGGQCPDADTSSDGSTNSDSGTIAEDVATGNTATHDATIVFAFVEEQNEDVGGIYADGDVVHAYVQCSCGTSYSDRWVADD